MKKHGQTAYVSIFHIGKNRKLLIFFTNRIEDPQALMSF